MSAKDLAKLTIDPKSAILQGSWADYEDEYSAEGSEAPLYGNISSSDVGTEESSGHMSDLKGHSHSNGSRRPPRGRDKKDDSQNQKGDADHHSRWPHDKYEELDREEGDQARKRTFDRSGPMRGKSPVVMSVEISPPFFAICGPFLAPPLFPHISQTNICLNLNFSAHSLHMKERNPVMYLFLHSFAYFVYLSSENTFKILILILFSYFPFV